MKRLFVISGKLFMLILLGSTYGPKSANSNIGSEDFRIRSCRKSNVKPRAIIARLSQKDLSRFVKSNKYAVFTARRSSPFQGLKGELKYRWDSSTVKNINQVKVKYGSVLILKKVPDETLRIVLTVMDQRNVCDQMEYIIHTPIDSKNTEESEKMAKQMTIESV